MSNRTFLARIVSARFNGSPAARRWIRAIIYVSLLVPRLASALTLTVPDQVPTIQGALDSFALGAGIRDTLFLRGGQDYHETPNLNNLALVVRWAPQLAGESRPRIDGLYITEAISDIQGVHFSGPVIVASTPGNRSYFSHSRFDSGLNYSGEAQALSIVGCTIAGGVLAGADGEIVVDSCFIDGGLRLTTNGNMLVTHTTVTGSPGSVGIGGDKVGSATVVGCTVRGHSQGIILFHAQYSVDVRDNVVEDCGIGIYADAEDCTIVGNEVRRSGGAYAGIHCYADNVVVTDNIIQDCFGAGLLAKGWSTGLIERNLVSGCGGDGIWTDSPSKVRNNTSCSNAGSGITIDSNSASGTIEITNNIGYANGAYGLNWSIPLAGRVECNDWFANQLGPVGGDAVAVGDLLLDPMFCDTTQGDYHLSDASPLVDHATCGLIGALGIGCGATPTLVSQFTSERIEASVRLRWESSVLSPNDVWIERAERDQGPWSRVAMERRLEGGAIIELDHAVLPEQSYWYRLMTGVAGEARVISAPIESRGSVASGFKIVYVAPNPANGPASIAFTLAREAPIAIDLFDTQGRRLATLARGVLSAGRHQVEWSGRIDGQPAAHGLYLIHYRFPGGHEDGRLVVTR